MMKRRVFVLICLLTLALLVSGCGKKTEPKKTLTFAFWGGVEERELSKSLAEAFEKAHPLIHIKIISIVGSYESQLLTRIAGGAPPDIMLMQPRYMIDFAHRGVLLNLQPYMKRDKEFASFKNDIFPGLLEVNRFKGVPYSIPLWTNSLALYYNKTLFDEAGLEYPSEDWDWEKIVSAAQKLTKDKNGDGKIDQFGLYFCYGLELGGNFGEIYRYIRRNGGKLFNEDKTKCLIEMPETMEAIRWCIDLINKYHVSPSLQYSKENVGGVYEQGFLSGKIAMFVSGRWSMRLFGEAKNLAWGVSPEPKGKVKFNPEEAVLLGASVKTKYPEECWEFLKFMMKEEAQKIICEGRTDIPVRPSIVNSPLFLDKFSRSKENKVFAEGLKNAEHYPRLLGDGEWLKNANTKLELVVLKQRNLRDVCKEIAEEFEKMRVGKE